MNKHIRVVYARNAEALRACMEGRDVPLSALLDDAKVEVALVGDERGDCEFTVAHAALLCNNGPAIARLLQSDIDVANVLTRRGLSLLHCAVCSCGADVVDALIKRGCDPRRAMYDDTTTAMFAAYSGNEVLLRRFYTSDIACNNMTVLMAAAQGGCVDAMKYAASRGESMRGMTDCGRTVLDYAALGGHVEAMKYAMENGVSADDLTTLLSQAAKSGCVDAIALVLDLDAKLVAEETGDALQAVYRSVDALRFLTQRCRYGLEELQLMMFTCAKTAHIDSMRFLVSQGASLEARKNGLGSWSILHYALQSGNIETIEYVLQNGAFDVREERSTLLSCAARSGNVEAMKYIYERGADKVGPNGSDDCTIIEAAVAGSPEAMDFALRKGSTIDDLDNSGQCVLSAAAASGSLAALKYAFNHGAKFSGDSGWCNMPPLCSAALLNNLGMIHYLVDEQHEPPDASFEGRSLAKLSAGFRSVAAMRYFIEKGMHNGDDDDESLFECALNGGSTAAVQLALDAGGTEVNPALYETMLFGAIARNSMSLVSLAVDRNAPLEAINIFGRTALLEAAGQCKASTMRLLLEHGANSKARDNNGASLLLRAATGGAATMQLALQCGCNIDAVDNDGKTALHYAAESGCVESMRLALELGCCIECVSNDESTPLFVASRVDAMSFALECGACITHRDGKGDSLLAFIARNYGGDELTQFAVAKGAPALYRR